MRRVLLPLIIVFWAAACTKDIETDKLLETKSSQAAAVEGIIVATNGDDVNGAGTLAQPYASLEKAIAECAEQNENAIYLRGGEYRVDLSLSNTNGHITISAYPDERVSILGVEDVSTEWTRHSGNIWVTESKIKPWQLFENGKMLNIARWPNVVGFIEDEQAIAAEAKDGSMWHQDSSWCALAPYTADEQTNLYEQGVIKSAQSIPYANLAGALAILNIGSFETAYAEVIAQASDTQFTFNTEQVEGLLTIQKPDHAHFFLEGKLEMLDTAGEWFYDKTNGRIYLWCKDGANPNGKRITGKTQSYAINFVQNVHNITLKDLNFFGTTIKAGRNCTGISVIGCTFSYPSHSKRALGEGFSEFIDVTSFDIGCSSTRILNSTFEYTEGEGIILRGDNSIIENCLFRHIDYSCANLQNIGSSINLTSSTGSIFRGNTIYVCGASETILAGANTIIADNEAYSTAHLQNDGAIIQMMVHDCQYTMIYGNWFHNSRRTGVRIDGNKEKAESNTPADRQTFASVFNNVLWDCGGMMIKGDYHYIVNNTIFSSHENPNTITLYMINREDTGGANSHSLGINNLTEFISSYYPLSLAENGMPNTLPDGVYNNYVSYYTQNRIISDVLMDSENRDFRPLYFDEIIDQGEQSVFLEFGEDIPQNEGESEADYQARLAEYRANIEKLKEIYETQYYENNLQTDDLGALGYNPDNYNVPGRQLAQCSAPVPANGAISEAAGLMLAWRAAFGANSVNLYMGTTSEDLRLIRENITTNCFYPSKGEYPINQRAKEYFWRVDAVVDGEPITGEVWNFKLY